MNRCCTPDLAWGQQGKQHFLNTYYVQGAVPAPSMDLIRFASSRVLKDEDLSLCLSNKCSDNWRDPHLFDVTPRCCFSLAAILAFLYFLQSVLVLVFPLLPPCSTPTVLCPANREANFLCLQKWEGEGAQVGHAICQYVSLNGTGTPHWLFPPLLSFPPLPFIPQWW